jgi:hypothetical protein
MPRRTSSDRTFDRQVARLQRQAGQGPILVVKSMKLGRGGRLPRPSDAVWRFADGHEEPVVAISFQNVDRRILRDIVASSGRQSFAYLSGWSLRDRAGTTSGLPMLLESPQRLLVAEVEAVFPGPEDTAHVYAAPPMD